MVIAVDKSPTRLGRIYGHIGIYVGNNLVRDDQGYVREMTMRDWLNFYSQAVSPGGAGQATSRSCRRSGTVPEKGTASFSCLPAALLVSNCVREKNRLSHVVQSLAPVLFCTQ